MSKVIAFRVDEDEEELIKQATTLEARPGDRGGEGAFARAATLERARRVVEERSGRSNGSGEGHA